MSDPITVEIFNQNFRISADLEDPDYVHRAASYLDKKMREAAASGARRPLDIAIMAAMNIAEEVLTARTKKEVLLSKADQRIGDFTRLLDDQPSGTDDKSGKTAATSDSASSSDDPQEDGGSSTDDCEESGTSPTRRF